MFDSLNIRRGRNDLAAGSQGGQRPSSLTLLFVFRGWWFAFYDWKKTLDGSTSPTTHQGKGHLCSKVDLEEVGYAEVTVEPRRSLHVDSEERVVVLRPKR